MKLLLVSGVIVLGSVLLLPISVSATEYIGCNLNGFGSERGPQLNSPDGLNLFHTRHSNRGKGNGGESYNVYVTVFPYGARTVDLIECISNEDEESVGRVFVDFTFDAVDGYIDTGPVVASEYDPGRIFD